MLPLDWIANTNYCFRKVLGVGKGNIKVPRRMWHTIARFVLYFSVHNSTLVASGTIHEVNFQSLRSSS